MTYGSATLPSDKSAEIAGLVQRTIQEKWSAHVAHRGDSAEHIDLVHEGIAPVRVIDYGDGVSFAHLERAQQLPVCIPDGPAGHAYLVSLLNETQVLH